MKVNEMKEALDNEFVGKDFNAGIDSVSIYTVGYYIEEHFIPEEFRKHISVDGDKYRVNLRINYRSAKGYQYIPLMHVDVRRAKGNSHYSWLSGSYCDWTVKGIDITYCDDGKGSDLEDMCQQAIDQARKSISDANEYEAKILELLKDLKEKTGYDEYKLGEVIDYMKKHWWSLSNKLYDTGY